ncbi:ABC transporter substrate-binding protein [Aquabacterium sp.]|uniref:ABC transporter substrate-binding protein n=1 Tax=Aquabacterium sp. TaxID=1872578 RepID=UPI003784537C
MSLVPVLAPVLARPRAALVAITLALAALTAAAQTVAIGVGADVTSADPHYHLYSPNQNIADHVFDRLIERADNLRMVPGLALSWRAIDELNWEFKLRPNVLFHDGTPFTAEDVVFSIERVGQIKDSPGPFTPYTKEIAAVQAVDPLTLRIRTTHPHPLLPNDLSVISIVSKKAASGATSADFNSGKAAIGTGPYKLARFTRGDRVELVRNEAYWGRKPSAEKLVFKVLTNDAARVAALLSGDVQAIDAVPVTDVKKLAANPDITVLQRAGTRLMYLYLDVGREVTPFVTDKDGKPLPHNPLKDLRVRQALSRAIDRELIRTQVMEGASRPSGQLMISGLPGYVAGLEAPAADIPGAKKLLAEAGYAQGFALTLHGTNNRYVQDDQILQALAQMWSRIGLSVKVEAQPAAVFFPRNNRGDYSVSMSGWVPDSADASSPLRAFLATRNKDKGMGTFNAGQYSNAKLDQLLERALTTIDDSQRDKLLQQAVELAMADVAVIPLHHQANITAVRKPIRYGGRTDERIYGFDFVLQPQP